MKPPVQTCAECQLWSTRYHELVKELLAMKREGFAPQPTMEHPAVETLPKEIIAEIGAIDSLQSATGRHLEGEAWARLKAGMPVEEVAALIRKGEGISL